MEQISLSSLVTNLSLRIDDSPDVDDILGSFSKRGQLSPIRVRRSKDNPKKFEVVFGNRRVNAARKLGWKTIAAEVVQVTDEEALLMAFSENIDRKGFTDYEKALLLEKLHKLSGKSYNEIGDIVGRSRAFVSQHVAMLHLFSESVAPKAELAKVLTSLSENHARILARIENMEERWNTSKLVVRANMGVRELERICHGRVDSSEREKRINQKEVLRKLIIQMITGLNNKDPMPFFRAMDNEEFNFFFERPPFERLGVSETKMRIDECIRRMWKKDRRVEDLDIHLHGESAYCTFNVLSDIVSLLGKATIITRSTYIFAKVNQTWKLVHAHCSSTNPIEVLNSLGNLHLSEPVYSTLK